MLKLHSSVDHGIELSIIGFSRRLTEGLYTCENIISGTKYKKCNEINNVNYESTLHYVTLLKNLLKKNLFQLFRNRAEVSPPLTVPIDIVYFRKNFFTSCRNAFLCFVLCVFVVVVIIQFCLFFVV